MLTCNLGANKINCFDGSYTKDQLKMWSKKGILLCEACGKPYEYCHGRVIPPYFRHKDKNLCEDKYSEVETEEHIQGKRDLYEWIKKQDGVTNVELEAWLPETKQRPDIMFKYNGQKCVMEYQCSPIATEYYERHELYQAAGIKDVWICGTEKYLKLNMREKTMGIEAFGYYNPENKLLYFASNVYPKYQYVDYLNYYSDIDIYAINFNGKTLYSRPLSKFRTSRNNILFDDQLSEIQSRSHEMMDKRRNRNNDRHNLFEPGENKHKGYENKYLNMQKEFCYKLYDVINKKLQALSNHNWRFYVDYTASKYRNYAYICVEPYIDNKIVLTGLYQLDKIKLFNMTRNELLYYIEQEEKLKELLLPVMQANKNKMIKYFNKKSDVRLMY